MKFKNLFSMLFAGMLVTATLTITSCGDDDADVLGPTIALSSNDFSGKIGETATVTATVVAPAGLKSLTITKYLGTEVDATYGTGGSTTFTHETHTETYELGEEGLTNPVRFNFTAEDDKGKIGTADFIITTEPSVAYLLVNFDWQWKSKLGKCLDSDPETEQIADCEKDNYFVFNADGTFKLEYGANTAGAGTPCELDGLRVGDTWSLNADETELTMNFPNIFDPTDVQTEVYKISEFTSTSIKSRQTIDLSFLGCIVYNWGFEWAAKPK